MITTKAGSSYWKRLIILVSKFINWASPCINGLYQLYLQFLRGYQLDPYDHQVFFSTFRCAKIPGIPGIPGICRQLHHPPIPFGTSWLLGVEYVYTYICVYMYIYIYVCVCIYIHTYVYTYIHIYVYTYIHMHTYAYTVMHIQLHFWKLQWHRSLRSRRRWKCEPTECPTSSSRQPGDHPSMVPCG